MKPLRTAQLRSALFLALSLPVLPAFAVDLGGDGLLPGRDGERLRGDGRGGNGLRAAGEEARQGQQERAPGVGQERQRAEVSVLDI